MQEPLPPQDTPEPDDDLLLAGISGEPSLHLLKWWDEFWARITSLGLGDVAMRVGSALATIGLIALVVWVMKGFFVTGNMVEDGSQPLELAAGGEAEGAARLPSYEGVAPVAGLSRSADTNMTAPSSAGGSRYEFTLYEVVSGDTIWGIAESFGLTPETLLWTNFDTLRDNPAAIYPGQVLNIPPLDGVLHTWYEGDGLTAVSTFFGLAPQDIIEWPGNNLSMETIGDFVNPNIEPGTKIFAPGGTRPFQDWTTALFGREETAESAIWGEGKCAPTNLGPVGNGTYIWPTIKHGVIGYEFSPEVNHWGVDLGGGMDSPIYAVDHGVVVYSGWNDWGYGNVIVIDQGNEIQTVYAHLNSFVSGCGDFVYQGDVIGYMGSTGASSGPHLHFEIRSGSSRMNPHKYID